MPIFLVLYLFGFGRMEHHVLDDPISIYSLILPVVMSSILVKPFDYYATMISIKHFGPAEAAIINYKVFL